MVRRTISRLTCLAFTLTTLLLLTCLPGLAQDKSIPGGPLPASQRLRKMTKAERLAAAQRTAQRKAAAAQKKQAAPNAQPEVKK
jgi:hypothetical protein